MINLYLNNKLNSRLSLRIFTAVLFVHLISFSFACEQTQNDRDLSSLLLPIFSSSTDKNFRNSDGNDRPITIKDYVKEETTRPYSKVEGTVVLAGSDDSLEIISIPFSFHYVGRKFNSINLSVNGFASLEINSDEEDDTSLTMAPVAFTEKSQGTADVIEFLYGEKSGTDSANALIDLKYNKSGVNHFVEGITGSTSIENPNLNHSNFPASGTVYRFKPVIATDDKLSSNLTAFMIKTTSNRFLLLTFYAASVFGSLVLQVY